MDRFLRCYNFLVCSSLNVYKRMALKAYYSMRSSSSLFHIWIVSQQHRVLVSFVSVNYCIASFQELMCDSHVYFLGLDQQSR